MGESRQDKEKLQNCNVFFGRPRLTQVNCRKLCLGEVSHVFRLAPVATYLHVGRIRSIGEEVHPSRLRQNGAEETLDSWRKYVHL